MRHTPTPSGFIGFVLNRDGIALSKHPQGRPDFEELEWEAVQLPDRSSGLPAALQGDRVDLVGPFDFYIG